MSPAKGQTKTHCIRGHDKRVVGAASNGWCNECRRLSYEGRGLSPGSAPARITFRNPYCPKGHHKPTVGVTKHYVCKACLKERNDAGYWRELRRRKSGVNAPVYSELPNLREVRLRAGLTQKEMAARIGITKEYYREVETGRKRARRRTLRKILPAISAVLHATRGAHRSRTFNATLLAVMEAERRGDPTAECISRILGIEPVLLGPRLRWLKEYGLVERFDHGPTWLATQEARRLFGGGCVSTRLGYQEVPC